MSGDLDINPLAEEYKKGADAKAEKEAEKKIEEALPGDQTTPTEDESPTPSKKPAVAKKENVHKAIKIEKVVVNIGVGEAGEPLVKAEKVLRMLTAQAPVQTISKTTNKDLNIRKDMPIGCKVTLRKEGAEDFLKRALWVKNNRVAVYSFDRFGNFSFGIPDYTNFDGMKYDPNIGIFGMDVCVSLTRSGYRIKKRRRCRNKIARKHTITKEEGIAFAKKAFNVEIVEE